MSDIFNKSNGYAGFYGPVSGDLELTIARANNNTNVTANTGFLADGYNIAWGRSVQIKRVFNNDMPIAIVGYGQGTVTIQGLIGSKEGFESIVGGAEDVCNPLTISIKSASGFSSCTGSQAKAQNVNIVLTGCLLASVNVQGQIESQSGTRLQQANVVFNIGGFTLE